jgi:S-layer protein
MVYAAAGTSVTTNALTSASDALTVKLGGDLSGGARVFGTFALPGVETVNFTMADTNLTFVTQLATATLTDTSVSSIVVTGNNGLALSNTAGTGTSLTNFDASGLTKGAVTYTAAALQSNVTVKGSLLGGDTLNFGSALGTVSITETAGTNTLTGSTANNNTITGGTGADAIVGGTLVDILNGGAGADAISTQATGTLSGAADQITLGTGSDTVTLRGDVAASGAMTVAAAIAAAPLVTDFSISGTNGTDILALSNTIGNYNGAVGALVGGGAAAASASVITSIATATGTAVATDTTADLIKLTTGVAAGATIQATFNSAIGGNTVTGVAANQSIFVTLYDTTNSRMLVLVDNVASGTGATTIESGDTVTLVGTISMTAADYANFGTANFAIIAA